MVIKKAEIHRVLTKYLLYGIAFSIPLENFVYNLTCSFHAQIPLIPEIRLTSTLIALLLFNWIIEAPFIRTFPLILKEKRRFLQLSFSFLYLFYIAGLVYTSNFEYAGLDLGIKLSLLIFPLLFSTMEDPIIRIGEFGRIIRFFALGCILITIILYGHAFYNSVHDHAQDAFYYSKLSWVFHPAYLSMYITFVISNILYHFLIRQSVHGFLKQAAHVLMLIYFFLFVILLSSKAGLIVLLVVITGYSLLLGFRYRRWARAVSFLVLSLLVIFIGLKEFPFISGRISQAGKDIQEQNSLQSSGKSTSDRIGIWKSSANIIKTHLLFGVGTGDVKDELLKEYKANSILPALEQKLNAHNQYLQTFVTLGMTGFLILVLMIFLPAWYSFREEQYLYLFFLLIFGINILVESMLEIQQGVIFYSFFNTLLFYFMRTGNTGAEKK